MTCIARAPSYCFILSNPRVWVFNQPLVKAIVNSSLVPSPKPLPMAFPRVRVRPQKLLKPPLLSSDVAVTEPLPMLTSSIPTSWTLRIANPGSESLEVAFVALFHWPGCWRLPTNLAVAGVALAGLVRAGCLGGVAGGVCWWGPAVPL